MERRSLLGALFLATQIVMAQSQPLPGPRTRAEQRLAVIAKKYASCDEFSAEGLRFKCIEETLKAYENEVAHLNAEVKSNLCPEMAKSFESTVRTWSTYYQTKKNHIGHLNDCQGTLALYTTYSALVQLAASRCSYLSSQLSDFRKGS